MIFYLIILMTTSLFSQVKCRTYVPGKDFLDHNLNRRQTYNLAHNPRYNPTEQQPTVFVNKGQYLNGWNENIMKGDRSPIIFTDNAPVTINYRGGRSGPEQPPNGFRDLSPLVVTSQGKVTVNYDDSEDDVAPPSNQDVCLLTDTMVELPSGIVMPYLKFKTISAYLLDEDQKSDIRVILENRNTTYKQFQETLRHYGCGDPEQESPRPSEIGMTSYVTLANGTLKVDTDDYRNIVSSITSGSETLMVPNVVSGKYSVYRSLIADELPELIASTFVITHEGMVVPFSTYYAVDREHFQRRPSTSVVPKVRQIKWHDGKLVDVQTVRHVIDSLRTPTMISFVFPNGKRMPFVRCGVEDPRESYDYDPEKVSVDVQGQCENVLLSHFNDILSAVHFPDDSNARKYRRFNPPAVFALDPKCLNTTSQAQPPRDGKVCEKSNAVDDRNYSGYSIHVMNKDRPPIEDEPEDKKLTVFGPVSAMEKNTGSDSNDTIRIILTSSSGTHEIKITNVLNNKKPLIYDITDKPINVRDLITNMPLNECDYSPVYLMNKTNISIVTEPVNPQSKNNCTNIVQSYTECNCEQISKNNETNNEIDITDTKNTTTSSNYEKNPTTSNITNTDEKYEPNNTSNNTVTTETGNNTTTEPKNNQNTSNPIIEGNTTPVTADNNNQTETKNTTTISSPNITANTTGSNNTNTEGKNEPNGNNTVTMETGNNTTTEPKNNQNTSNPIIEGNTTPVTADNNNQTETKNTTTISSPNITDNPTGSNNNNTDEKYEPNGNNTVTTETGDNTTTEPKNNQNTSYPVIEGNTTPVTADNNNQTETKNTTTISSPNITANTTGSNNTNTEGKNEPNGNNTVTMETGNNTTTEPKNNQNTSNPIIEGNTTPVTADNNNQTETKNTTTISSPNITANTTGSNNNNTDEKYEPNGNNTVTTETGDNTITEPKNNQNTPNQIIEGNTTPVTADNNNQTETKNTTTTSAPNITANTTGSNNNNTGDKYEPNDTSNNTVATEIRNETTDDPNHTAVGTGSNETPSVNSTAETTQTSGATKPSDVGPMENPETNTAINDDKSTEVYNTTGKTETNQPTPIYTETNKSPNDNSVTNNAKEIINVIVY